MYASAHIPTVYKAVVGVFDVQQKQFFYKEIVLILLLLFEVSFGDVGNRIYSSVREDSF